MSKGLALQDIISGIYDAMAEYDFPKNVRVYMLDQLGNVECVVRLRSIPCDRSDPPRRHRLSTGGSEKIQLTALLGAFKVAMELSTKKG